MNSEQTVAVALNATKLTLEQLIFATEIIRIMKGNGIEDIQPAVNALEFYIMQRADDAQCDEEILSFLKHAADANMVIKQCI